MHGQSSERPGMEDNAEAEQNSLAQAEERTRSCAGLLCRWPQRSTSSQILTPFTRVGERGRGSRLALQVGAHIKKLRDPSRISQN